MHADRTLVAAVLACALLGAAAAPSVAAPSSATTMPALTGTDTRVSAEVSSHRGSLRDRHAGSTAGAPSATSSATAFTRGPASSGAPLGNGSVARVSVPVPSASTFDAATSTLYVSLLTGDVSVVDAARCNARTDSGCAGAVVATIPHAGDIGLVVDPSTRTLYAGGFDTGLITVIDARTCNAHLTTGCTGPHPTISAGATLFELAVDPTTHTLYVGHVDPDIALVDTQTCNAQVSTGCALGAAHVTTSGGAPAVPTVDRSTSTLYVPENGFGDSDGTTLAVFDLATCNARAVSCPRVATAATGIGPVSALVDPATRTLYVNNQSDNTVSVIDATTCNAHSTSGCGTASPAFPVGTAPNVDLVLDNRTRTLYVANEESDTVSAVDVRHCRAGDTVGCPTHAPNLAPTLATGTSPFWIDEDPTTGTLYVLDNQDNDIAVLDAATCNARTRAGCRHEAPALADADGPLAVAVDATHHTALIGADAGSLTLVDTDECRGAQTKDCASAVEKVFLPGTRIRSIAVDPSSHTAYVGDFVGHRLLVIDTNTCHAGRTTGCAPLAGVVVASNGTGRGIAVNPITHTVYSAQPLDGTLAFFAGSRCNAVTQSGCPARAAVVPIGAGSFPLQVAVEPDTNSIFVSQRFADHVELFDGAACESNPATCSVVATLSPGHDPIGLAIDRETHTLYVANQAFDEAPGTLSLVDLNSCNAGHPAGCSSPWPTMPSGRGPWTLALDPSTHTMFATDSGDASTSLMDVSACSAVTRTGCAQVPVRVPIGDTPADLALDPTTHTLFAVATVGQQVSIIDARTPCRPPTRCLR